MSSPTITASAPGSLMLLGEHAVLHGRMAVVCAIDRRLRVQARLREDRRVRIVSALAEHETGLDELAPHPRLAFALAVVAEHAKDLPAGVELVFDSDFSATIGFGSSAATCVAAHAALLRLRGVEIDRPSVFQRAVGTIRRVQGLGSGADAAASVFGGLVAYRADPLEIHHHPATHDLTAVYSGAKRPTPEVVKLVRGAWEQHRRIYDGIYDVMGIAAEQFFRAAQQMDWAKAGVLLNIGQGLMDAIGVSNLVLAELVHQLRASPGILGAKISGSGLGDCVVGLGRSRSDVPPRETMELEIRPEGLVVQST